MLLNFKSLIYILLKIVLILSISLFIQINTFDGNNSRDGNINKSLQGRIYFAVAVPSSGQSFSRAFNKTLANITHNYLASNNFKKISFNISLETLVIQLPENGSFTSFLLEDLCNLFEGKHVVAVLVIGSSPAAFTVSWTARHLRIPVLWARGQSEFLPGFRSLERLPLEIHLAPTGRELVQALRGLLLHAHWHSYTVLADSASATSLRSVELWQILQGAPLHPTLVSLPSPLRAQSLFRKLADISRSTRGVVVLCSDSKSAIRILDEAKRLNMMDGHFVWIWIDTASSINIRNASEDADFLADRSKRQDEDDNNYLIRDKRSAFLNGDMHVNYLLKNDHYLMLNSGNDDNAISSSSVENSKINRKVTETQHPGRISSSYKSQSFSERKSDLPAGLLSLKPLPIKIDRHMVKGAVRLLISSLKEVIGQSPPWILHSIAANKYMTSCWIAQKDTSIFTEFGRELKLACTEALAGKKFAQEIGVDKVDKSLVATFEVLNLVPERNINNNTSDHILETTNALKWKRVGLVSGRNVRLDTIVWPGGDLSVAAVSIRARTVFRVVTALAPPFVMESELDEDGQCLRGLPCHRVLTSDKDNLTLVFNEIQKMEDDEEKEDEEEKDRNDDDYDEYNNENDEEMFFPFQKFKYRTNCCYGLSMDLLENVAQELEFDFRLYIVADGMFGSRIATSKVSRAKRDVEKKFLTYRFKGGGTENHQKTTDTKLESNGKWNGIVGDLVSGAAHMSFAALSVSSARSEVIDFSVPYFFSGVSFLASPQQRSDIPLLAFLLPFSFELWLAIFISLNITAVAVAIYEWLSPFGLNPWGRQRSKNFSMSSALWVMWGLLCGHLVAFKAPKSWPNKFLINVWGGFSVIFVASYTANIAALIAGLFFQNTVSNYHDRSLLSQKIGTPRSSAAEYYVQKANQLLWQHMKTYSFKDVEEGVQRLKNRSLDILIADTPILDYYRATDHGCKLQKIGDTINEDTYAIGMTKGFPLKDSISAVISKYSSNGYMDILQEKWYGGLPCFKLAQEIAQPRPLGVRAVSGVFILLFFGVLAGFFILLMEHLFFKHILPRLRDKPKQSMWRSRNIMFFSQKLYRFINCVELVSPHHAARELVHTIRQGQITSLFQKSIKRKEHEQRRRRKSKAQFFEMIQEIRSNLRRQQQQEEINQTHLESVTEVDSENNLSPEEKKSKLSPNIIKRAFLRTSPKSNNEEKIRSPTNLFGKQLFSPRSNNKAKSAVALNVRRFSSDSVFNTHNLATERSASIGRRLSKDATSFLNTSPPDINSRRSSYLDIISTGSKLSGKSPILSIENISDCGSTKSAEPIRKLSDCESIGKKLATLPKYQGSMDKTKLQPQHSFTLGKSDETLTTNSANPQEKSLVLTPAKSFNSFDKLYPKNNLTDDEMAKRNKEMVNQLQAQFKTKTKKKIGENNNRPTTLLSPNPQIRIEVEDIDSVERTRKKNPPLVKTKRNKTRHQSLGDPIESPLLPEYSKRNKLQEPSRSLDSGTTSQKKSNIRTKSKHIEENDDDENDDKLPPAPPPPNCSPRNSDGKSPLDRLSKDDLVKLWRSSESELRSHLLKAIRDKEEPSDPT